MELLEVQAIEIIQSSSKNDTYILVLHEEKNDLNIPIMIGEYEAQMIFLARERIKPKRPLTHNLLCEIIVRFSLIVSKVVVEKFSEGIFYSYVYVSDGMILRHFDCRLSDAVALALSLNVPIFITKEVLDDVGVSPKTFYNSENLEETDTSTVEELEMQLRILENNEEYEKAAELLEKINKLNSENKKNN